LLGVHDISIVAGAGFLSLHLNSCLEFSIGLVLRI